MSKNNQPIRIGIDVNEANVVNKVGSNEYAFEIIKTLHEIDQTNTYTLYSSGPIRPEMPKPRKNWQYKVIPPARLWTQWRLPMELLRHKDSLDVFYSPGHYAPRFSPVPTVVTIMDLAYLYFPEFFLKKDAYQLNSWSKYSIRNACHIITISQNTKKDIIHNYQIESAKITIAYPGFSQKKSKIISQKSNLNSPYILFVGTIQPRKNLVRLIKAFELMQSDHRLIFAGKQGWMSDEVYQAIESSSKKSYIKLLGFVPDSELPALYNQSDCVVMPGLYEGFGMPALEAIKHQAIPVIANTGSLPEVVGEDAIMFDPYSIDSILDALQKAVQLTKSQKNNLIEKYTKNITKFNWTDSANKIVEVLREVAIS